MEKFTLNHTVLYAKGWYKRTDFWSDIRAVLSADGYSAEYFTENDCANVILRQLERLPLKYYNTVSAVVYGIQDCNVWKHGYFTKTNDFHRKSNEEYNLNKAIIKYCLSNFFGLEKSEWICKPPSKKVLPFDDRITIKDVISNFNKKPTSVVL